MASYLKRYLAGDEEVVWQDLRVLGRSVASVQEDAAAVATELVDRALFNLKLIHERLIELKYKFAAPKSALVTRTVASNNELAKLERDWGKLPIVVHAWYDKIASVDFTQNRQQLYGRRMFGASSTLAGLGCNAVLVAQRISKAKRMAARLCEMFESEQLEDEASVDDLDDSGLFFPLGEFASNSEPKGFSVPNPILDPVIYDDGAGEVTFVDELRRAFSWGGFPFWKTMFTKGRCISPVGATPDCRTILPLLSEGLKRI